MEKPVLIKDLGLKKYTKNSVWRCRFGIYECPYCGKHFKCANCSIKSGNTKSCGCFRSISRKVISKKKWYSGLRLHRIWRGMRERCNNPNVKSYKNYGGRSIKICNEWEKDFMSFYNWAMSNGYTQGLSIDRINNDGDYEPSNCRFSDYFTQNQNTRLLKSNNTSGYRCVSFSKSTGKWVVQINYNYKKNIIGYFNSKIEAAVEYNKWVIENNINYPLNKVNCR